MVQAGQVTAAQEELKMLFARPEAKAWG